MTCRKDSDKCLCLKRKHDGCEDCINRAFDKVRKTGKDLGELIKTAKESDDPQWELYIGIRGTDEDSNDDFILRSAIDILRGVCDLCDHDNYQRCRGCMWMNGNGDEDRWTFRHQGD